MGAWIEIWRGNKNLTVARVAPFMGAWIEIHHRLNTVQQLFRVAPFMGAWIEMSLRPIIIKRLKSHPLWVRGLKYLIRYNVPLCTQSHPLWVRGLKSYNFDIALAGDMSHPLWVRGLKLCRREILRQVICRTLYGCVD